MRDELTGLTSTEAVRQMEDAVETATRRSELFTGAQREIDEITVTE